jgi:hypothetical protein
MRHSCAVLLWGERAPEDWLDTEHIEVVARYEIAPNAFVVPVTAQTHRRKPRHDQTRQHLISISEINVVWVGECKDSVFLSEDVQRDQLFRSSDREWPQQNCVDEAEDRCIGSYAEAKREDRNGCKRRAPCESTEAVAEVLGEDVHGVSEKSKGKRQKAKGKNAENPKIVGKLSLAELFPFAF